MTKVTTREPEAAVERVRRARRVLITSHSSPDGDALGSELALAELLDHLGVEAMVVNRDPGPANLDLLPGVDRVVVSQRLPEDFPRGFDLTVTVECPDLDRPGFPGLGAGPVLNIDHHKANPSYGEVNFLDDEAPAVGEMILQMYRTAGVEPSAAAATNMFVALSTDTGDFCYANATPRAFRAAAELVDAGARPAEVAGWIHEGRSAASVRLLGEALRNLELACGGRLAVFAVDRAAFDRAGAGPEDTEDLVAVPRSIAGVRVVAFLKQWDPGVIRVSLRSKQDIDVRAVAARFGGGGHTNASGCTMHGDLGDAQRELVAALRELVEVE